MDRSDVTQHRCLRLWGQWLLVQAFYSPHRCARRSWGAADSQSSVELALSLGGRQWGNQTVMDDVEKLSAIDLRNWTTL